MKTYWPDSSEWSRKAGRRSLKTTCGDPAVAFSLPHWSVSPQVRNWRRLTVCIMGLGVKRANVAADFCSASQPVPTPLLSPPWEAWSPKIDVSFLWHSAGSIVPLVFSSTEPLWSFTAGKEFSLNRCLWQPTIKKYWHWKGKQQNMFLCCFYPGFDGAIQVSKRLQSSLTRTFHTSQECHNITFYDSSLLLDNIQFTIN